MQKIGLAVAAGAVLAALAPTASSRAQEAFPADPGLAAAARAFLSATPGDRRQWGHTNFDTPERFNWAYTPVTRAGYAIAAMEPDQRELTWKLVNAGLGERGRVQARQIITLEGILFARSDGDDRRNPDAYLLTLFGTPGRMGRWGWRFEGHHLSLNFTLLDGRVVGTTPAFFGGNPAHVVEGEHDGLRPFGAEEDRGRELLQGLTAEPRRRALISPTAPRDILTGSSQVAARPQMLGLPVAEMDPTARERLLGLIDLYAARLEPTLAAAEIAAIQAAGVDEIRFAWAGGTEVGEPHYYRIQGPGFVIEYDNTQSNANHVHTVWRNFERDFGRDPLREHLATHHRPGSPHAGDHAH